MSNAFRWVSVNDREEEDARRSRGEVTTSSHQHAWNGVASVGSGHFFFVSAGPPNARTLWMSFFFGFRSPYFALSFSSCCRITSSGEGCRGGGVEGFRSGWV